MNQNLNKIEVEMPKLETITITKFINYLEKTNQKYKIKTDFNFLTNNKNTYIRPIVNGFTHGTAMSFDDSGQLIFVSENHYGDILKMTHYKDGKKDGEEKYFDKDGKLEKIIYFKDGKELKTEKFDK